MKRTKAVSFPLVLLLVVVLFLPLFLASCGGGGGGGSKDIAATAYTGERSLAYLAADNAEALILGAYGSRSRGIEPFDLEPFIRSMGLTFAGRSAGGEPRITKFFWIDA